MAEAKLPSNSDKFSEEKPKAEKIVQGNVTVQKKSEVSKLAKDFFTEDVKSVRNYILKDILVPSLKKLLEDVITNGINAVLWGNTKGRGNGSQRSNVSRVSYRDYYDKPQVSYSRSYGYDMDDVIFPNRSDAEDVLDAMEDTIRRYKIVSIGDLYDFIGNPGSHTDYKYGWTSLRGAQILHTRRGWVIDLPKAMPIE